jgi:hypothetical protein
MILHVRKLSNVQSEIWRNDEPRHTVATNAIRASKALYSCKDALWSVANCCPVWSADDLTTS